MKIWLKSMGLCLIALLITGLLYAETRMLRLHTGSIWIKVAFPYLFITGTLLIYLFFIYKKRVSGIYLFFAGLLVLYLLLVTLESYHNLANQSLAVYFLWIFILPPIVGKWMARNTVGNIK